jgi:DNA-binding MarR family transcriptional regulator
MAAVRPVPLPGLAAQLARMLGDELLGRLAAAGYDDLRPAHNSVIPHVPPEGIRLTDLAERAGMTKQAMSELVLDLEHSGYLQRRPDESDARAKVIEFTDKGLASVQVALDALDDIERELADRIGERQLRSLRRTLEILVRD